MANCFFKACIGRLGGGTVDGRRNCGVYHVFVFGASAMADDRIELVLRMLRCTPFKSVTRPFFQSFLFHLIFAPAYFFCFFRIAFILSVCSVSIFVQGLQFSYLDPNIALTQPFYILLQYLPPTDSKFILLVNHCV